MKTQRFILLAGAAIAAVMAIMMLEASGTAHAGKIDPTVDPDNDGCTTSEELGRDPAFGGMRDPHNPNDFFDTPPRDNVIAVNDIARVVGRFGQVKGMAEYTVSFDRSPPPPGGDVWDLGPPDGAISVGDILSGVRQFGHRCVELPGGWCGGDVYDDPDMMETVPPVVDEGGSWRDCFELRDDETGQVKDYLIREATLGVEDEEEFTDEQALAQGFELPSTDQIAVMGGEIENAAPIPWVTRTCWFKAWISNAVGQHLGRMRVDRRYTTTPYTNIVWPPPPATITIEKTNWGWDDEAHNLSTYAVAWYQYPNIVSIGQTYGAVRFELGFDTPFGHITVQSRTAWGRLNFKYRSCSLVASS